jgi:tetratricopeptide (TPR) repeat protein
MDRFMKASPLTLLKMRARDRARRWLPLGAGLGAGRCAVAAALLAALVLGMAGQARAEEPVKGEIKVVNEANYTRLVFRLDEIVDSKVRQSGAILVIEFKKPVAIAVDRINAGAPTYISAARRDPDGKAVRIALAQKLRINAIPAAERLYVDLLPEPWTGVLPGLPQDVVDELANRTRLAEAQLNKQRLAAKPKDMPTVRVKVAKLPTFMRYVFELPKNATVTPERADGKLLLQFDQPIKWDLADAKATLPPTVDSVDAEADFDSVAVVFALNGAPEVHSFHEDRNFVVDVGRSGEAATPQAEAGGAEKIAAPKTVPVKGAPSVPKGEPINAPAIERPETVPAKGAPKDVPAVKDVPAIKDAPAKAPHAAAMEPAKEPVKDAMKEPAAAPVKVAAKEAVKDAAKEPAKESMKDAAPPKAVAAASPAKPELGQPATVAPSPESRPAAAAQSEAKSEAKFEAKSEAPPPEAKAPANAQANAQSNSPAAAADSPPPVAQGVIGAIVNASGDNTRIEFPFATPTPAAVFRRSDTLWLVFDNAPKIDLSALTRGVHPAVRNATFTHGPDGAGIVRLRLTRPQMASAVADGPSWVITLGDTAAQPSGALAIARNVLGQNKASILVPFDGAKQIHTITDPDLNDRLMVVTALAPARGFLKGQDFVELRALPSTQGVVVQPIADDLTVAIEPDKVVIGRPSGLSLSAAVSGAQQQQAPGFRALTFDTQTWGFDRQTPFLARQSELIGLAAAAPVAKRRHARLNLARFYIAREMGAEAKAVLDVALADQRGGDDVTGSVLKAIANMMLDRNDEALKELSGPQLGEQQDVPVWRAIAHARLGQWAEAYAGFKAADNAVRALPVEMQRIAMRAEMRSAIEVRDFANATRIANEFETMGLPADFEPSIAVLTGRLYESLGRKEDALVSYRAAAASRDRRSAAQGRLREIELLNQTGDMPRAEVIHELETLTTTWRGDETESGGLRLLAHLYTEDNRYRDAFHVMRTALRAHPDSDQTRRIQDEAAATFESLFLAGKGDALPPVEALGLFYDFRELTPIGRRGDEMIRRLADRLVSVDLLDQAAELLQHQVDHRLSGAARAQVATRLAVVYLMNRKPDRALAVLQKTRTGELSNELRDQRLLLEARAISDGGRHELALEVIANIKGREAIRLRSDILWAAKRWREAAEQIELMYGTRWRDFTPLTDAERSDILRAAIGYALSEEQLSLGRLREKYAAKFAEGPDRRAFDVVSQPIGAAGPDFQDIANKLAATDTLEGFLRDLRARYPEAPTPDAELAKDPAKVPAKDAPKGAATDAAKTPVAAAGSALPPKAPAGTPLKPDKTPTGAITPDKTPAGAFKPRMPPTFGYR